MVSSSLTVGRQKKHSIFKRAIGVISSVLAAAYCSVFTAFAFGQDISIDASGVDADQAAPKLIGILLDICMYAGAALAVYGVYEVIMSFMQNQPEAKTKGIIMALAGAVMIGMKAILTGLGLGIS